MCKCPHLIVVGVLLALVGWGCEAPKSITLPEQRDITFGGTRVTWNTNEPTLGVVRWGNRPGEYDRVAYPASLGRGDKAFLDRHNVPILTAGPADSIYYQVLDVTEDGRRIVSSERFAVFSANPPATPLLEWTMIDVGFGDSHILTMPTTGKRILIDAGERGDWHNVDRYLKAEGITFLDYVVATHVHADHMGGMVGAFSEPDQGVVRVYDVGMFLDSPNKSDFRSVYSEVLGILADRGIPLDTLQLGDTHLTHPELDWEPNLSVEVINAGFGSTIGGNSSGDWLNNDSIVFRFSYGDVDFIMGGDAESPVENRMFSQFGPRLESEALKVHHHGHRDTSVPVFLDTVNPRVGLVPIASYESFPSDPLPHSGPMERLRDRNVHIYASDRAEALDFQLSGDNGVNVTLYTDGKSYEVGLVPSDSRHTRGKGTLVPLSRSEEDVTP